MFLKKISLLNFRNYSKLSLEFDARSTILLGNNAVGKSNLLEAIYLLSTTKSARAEVESEFIKEGESVCKVEGIVTAVIPAEVPSQSRTLDFVGAGIQKNWIPGQARDDNDILEITMQMVEGDFKKQVLVNGIPRRTVDFIGQLPAVIFYPSDINMITGSPSLRRWHLDLSLAQVDTNFKKHLTLYEQVVTSRNRVLKRIREGEGGMEELTYWTDQLIEHGQIVSSARRQFFEFVNSLPSILDKFEFKYHESALTQERIDQYSSREIAAVVTLIGPHRDDFSVVLPAPALPRGRKAGIQSKDIISGSPIRSGMTGGQNLAHFGSRGQQRLATLAFKLFQLEYMAKITGIRPILLLDDVFSELDGKHRGQVIEIVGKQQTIIATVELEHIPKSFLDEARILKVTDGIISPS